MKQRGFTLLEAIVALVLIGTTGMALLAWMNTGLGAAARMQDASARGEALQNVLEQMQTVNPMRVPIGHADFGTGAAGYRIDWNSQALTDPVDGVAFPQGLSPYQVALYRTHVQVSKPADPHWFDLDLKLVGYKQVRAPSAPAFGQ